MPVIGEINGRMQTLRAYALKVLPVNGCDHEHAWHDFLGNGAHHVRCMDCGGTSHSCTYGFA